MNDPEVIKVSCVSSFSSTNAGEDWGNVAEHEVELPVLSEYEGERHGREVIASKSFSPPACEKASYIILFGVFSGKRKDELAVSLENEGPNVGVLVLVVASKSYSSSVCDTASYILFQIRSWYFTGSPFAV